MMGSDREWGFARYQLPAIIWALLIFATSSMPGWVFPHVSVRHADKIVHFIYYFVFALLVSRALKHQSWSPDVSRFSLILGFLLATAYGVSDEVHQLFVPERSADPQDLIADMAGALVGVVILGLLRKIRKERRY
jgi:VanZ family protein